MFKIATEDDPKRLLDRMFDNVSVQAFVTSLDRPEVFYADCSSGFLAYSGKLGEEERSFLEEELGISPTNYILFRLNKFEDRELAKHLIIRATIALLKITSNSDAILLFNGEEILFLRSNGELFINSLMDFWDSSYLDLVTLPYKMKEFPIL